MSALVNSGYLDLLSEYSTTSQGGNQTVTRGTITKPYTITPTTATTATVKDSSISKELAAQVKAGKLPAIQNDAQGKPNTLYVIFFPTGVIITDPSGSKSCDAFCGYHSSGSNYLYAVIPDLSQVQTYTLSDGGTVTEPCGYGCAYQAKTKPEVDWFNGTISHEIGEAVSDPVGGSGWYDQNNTDFACAGSQSQNQPGGGEIGDVCVGFWDDQNGTGSCEDTVIIPGTNIAAQQTWSNKLEGCAVNNAALSPQCPPGGCVDGGAGPVDPGVDGGGSNPNPGMDASTGENDASSGADSTVPNPPPVSEDGGTITPPPPPTSNPTPTGPDGSTGSTTNPTGGDGGNEDFGPGGGSSSGCGCRTVPVETTSPFGFAGALAALAGVAGRRRSRRKQ
jgi:MYXO-CTERM domain-containing protein